MNDVTRGNIVKYNEENSVAYSYYLVIYNENDNIGAIRLSTGKGISQYTVEKYLGTGFFVNAESGKERVADVFRGVQTIQKKFIARIVTTLSPDRYFKVVSALTSLMLGKYTINELGEYEIEDTTLSLNQLFGLMSGYYPTTVNREEATSVRAEPVVKKKTLTQAEIDEHNSRLQEKREQKDQQTETKPELTISLDMQEEQNKKMVIERRYRKLFESSIDDRVDAIFDVFGSAGGYISPSYVKRVLFTSDHGREVKKPYKNSLMVNKEEFTMILNSTRSIVAEYFRISDISAMQLKSVCTMIYHLRKRSSQAESSKAFNEALEEYTNPGNTLTVAEIAIKHGVSTAALYTKISGRTVSQKLKEREEPYTIITAITDKYQDKEYAEKFAEYFNGKSVSEITEVANHITKPFDNDFDNMAARILAAKAVKGNRYDTIWNTANEDDIKEAEAIARMTAEDIKKLLLINHAANTQPIKQYCIIFSTPKEEIQDVLANPMPEIYASDCKPLKYLLQSSSPLQSKKNLQHFCNYFSVKEEFVKEFVAYARDQQQ